MKHGDPDTTASIISAALEAADIAVSERAIEGMATHLDAMLVQNRVVNLTAIADVHSAAALHVADSLVALREIGEAPPGPLADIGSGAGYPGIPLAIVTGRPVTLIESVGKKARFLQEMADRLAAFCELSVAQTRAEALARDEGGVFSVVTARAVSSLASLVELASPLLAPGGWMVALKGPLNRDELERGKVAAGMVGMRFQATRELVLPGGQERSVITFQRREVMPEIRVPRSPGKAQRNPLA